MGGRAGVGGPGAERVRAVQRGAHRLRLRSGFRRPGLACPGSSGCVDLQLDDLHPEEPPPHDGEEHREQRPLQPVADVQRAAHGRAGPLPLPGGQPRAGDHRAEREQVPQDPARGEDQLSHAIQGIAGDSGRDRVQLRAVARRSGQDRYRPVRAPDLHPPVRAWLDPPPPDTPVITDPRVRRLVGTRDPGRADRHARAVRGAQRAQPDRRAAAAGAAERAAGGAERPGRAGRAGRPGRAAAAGAAAGRLGRARGLPADPGRVRAARGRAGRAPARPRRAGRGRAGRADRGSRARAVPRRPGDRGERDHRPVDARRHLVAAAGADPVGGREQLGRGGGDGRPT